MGPSAVDVEIRTLPQVSLGQLGHAQGGSVSLCCLLGLSGIVPTRIYITVVTSGMCIQAALSVLLDMFQFQLDSRCSAGTQCAEEA